MSHQKPIIHCVLFDLDGTLVDTSTTFYECMKQCCKEFDLNTPDQHSFTKSISHGATGMVEAVIGKDCDQQIKENIITYFLNIYRNNLTNNSTIFPALLPFIKQLEQNSIPWGIVTNKHSQYAQPLIDSLCTEHQLAPCCLICPDHVKNAKPDPEPLLMAAKKANCKPQQCIYIGDHERDIQAAKAANMHSIAAAYGYVDSDHPASQWQADFYAASDDKLVSIIETHFELKIKIT